MVMRDEAFPQEKDGDVKVPCEVYSRIVGYLRPVQAWNDGKQQEFEERQTFEMPTTQEDEG